MGWRGPVTHRQFLAWRAWWESEWNQPSRTDHYLMRVGAILLDLPHLFFGKGSITLTDPETLKMKFRFGQQSPPQGGSGQAGSSKPQPLKKGYPDINTDPEGYRRYVERSKAVWGGIMSYNRKKVESPEEFGSHQRGEA